MTYNVLKLVHIIGVIVIGAGLFGFGSATYVTASAEKLPQFFEAVRNIAVFYDSLVIPGALLLFASGTWLIVEFFRRLGFSPMSHGFPGWSFCFV